MGNQRPPAQDYLELLQPVAMEMTGVSPIFSPPAVSSPLPQGKKKRKKFQDRGIPTPLPALAKKGGPRGKRSQEMKPVFKASKAHFGGFKKKKKVTSGPSRVPAGYGGERDQLGYRSSWRLVACAVGRDTQRL